MSAEQLAGTIGAVIDERAVDSESRPFITCSGATIAYGDFAERVWRLTGALAELGVRPGDKLCLFLPNGLPFALTTGPDGNLWFSEQGSNQLGRITPAGIFTEFPTGSQPTGVFSPRT